MLQKNKLTSTNIHKLHKVRSMIQM